MKKLRVGVIGLGIGTHHIKAYQAHPGAEGETVMVLLDAIYRSARTGRPVRVG